MAGLSLDGEGLDVVDGPHKASLKDIVGYCESNNVVAVAIDAQLTAAISEENGFRTSDMELRRMLAERQGSRNWVAAAAGLMAVPVRGRLLADHLSPTVGTVIETHPRASLLFGLGEEAQEHVREYKPKSGDTREQKEARRSHVEELWRLWSKCFRISCCEPVREDGALDALVCATVAYKFHREPSALHKLRHEVSGKVGRGPFYVLECASE